MGHSLEESVFAQNKSSVQVWMRLKPKATMTVWGSGLTRLAANQLFVGSNPTIALCAISLVG